MDSLSRLHSLVLAGLAAVLILSSCSVSTNDLQVTRSAASPALGSAEVAFDGLPVLGPVPGSSHWHAAYVVRVCDDVLDPFDSTDDPLGIHSHSDGLMHIHPFFEEAGYERAKLSVFADAMGFSISDGELTLPGGGTWRDGDLCDGVPGRVFVDRWRQPSPDSAIERIFAGLDDLRYLADGELYQIAFAPADSPPVVPPALAILGEVSNLAPPPAPWIDVDPSATLDQVQVWPIGGVSGEPCADDAVPERVLSGVVRCFAPAGAAIAGGDAIVSAQAVSVNRRAALDLRIGASLQELIGAHFQTSGDPMAIAIEVDGFVVTAPQIVRPPVTPDRLVVSGGFSVETAIQLAAILNG